MLPRQYPLRPRVFGLAFAVLGTAFLALPVAAQNPNYPAVPPPTPVPADSLPAIPAATKPAPAKTVPVPSQAPQPQAPASSPTVQQVPQPASPLDAPNPASGTQPAPQQHPVDPNALEAPTQVQTPQPAAQQPNDSHPLEQPVTVQPAQPPQAEPVNIAPPSPVASLPSIPTEYPVVQEVHRDHLGSTYIPDDSWVYPAALRLYSMGYLDSAFISMRPWTRRSLLHMLEKSGTDIQSDGNEQAQDIYAKLMTYLQDEVPGPAGTLSSAMSRGSVYGLHTGYSRFMGISGLSLRDSYHLGQTIVNDYGRPYQPGFNNVTGFSTVNEWNRFSLYIRGEYQHAPSAAGYSYGLASLLSSGDEIAPFAPPQVPQDTIPYGPIASQNPFRLQEAALSVHLLGHEISGGKTDAWLGPAQGASMAWGNNAENIYSFRINRVEPLHIPYFDRVFGPLRYDFFVGSLKGHTFPRSPWVHAEMFSLRPTNNFEFSFERTVIWGGHCATCTVTLDGQGIDEPVTLHSFFRSFFSLSDTQSDPGSKASRNDPGARYSDFSFSWRLPFLRRSVTLYTDSIAHDDVTPISAPRRAAYRPGVYVSQLPGLPKMDFRIEAANTDCSTLRCINGVFNYFEAIQRNGYTNKGFIMGDWVGREAKGGQAWLTYHLSGNEWVQLEYLYKKTPKDFIAFGTTQNQVKVEVVKRLRPDVELDAWYQYEKWIAPVYQATHQNDNTFSFQFTFYPKLRSSGAHLNGK